MELTGQFPPKCEIDALTDAVIKACDPMDGVTDGIISDPEACSFEPFSMVGVFVNFERSPSAAHQPKSPS